MTTLIAFIRAINLASTNRVRMADLRAWLEELGYENVRTLLQSGNVVLDTTEKPTKVEKAIADEIEKRSAIKAGVMVRTARELAEVIDANPLEGIATDPKKHLVAFLSDKPKTATLEAIQEQGFAPERFEPRGREIYIWVPNGIQRSPLLKALSDKRLGVSSTVRNWNTVTKLHELA